jgi:putative chitinase
MPQYAMALSVDIKPGQTGKEANKLALHTGRNGEPGLLMKTVNLRESTSDYKIHNTEKLDRVLAKCCRMIERGQQTDPERYGQVAACVIDPDHNYVYGINLPGANGTRRHAERVAIDKYRKTHGDIPAGSIVVTTLSPCNAPMDERSGESCKDLLNSAGIHKVYCGYIDPTQHDDDDADFTIGVTQNDEIWESCKAFADTFLHEDDLEEDWKSALAGVAAAGAMAFTPAPANSTAAPAVGPAMQPAAVQQAPMAGPQGALSQAAQAAGIKGTELAQFMAQCEHESGNFTHLEELGGKNYLAKYDPTVNPAKAKALGNTKAGDGAKYKGRGFIQITGKANYASAGRALGMDLVNNPELAAKPDVAAKIAVWYWQNRVTPYVQNFADTRSVTKRINPGLQGLQDREENFKDYQQQTATVAAPPARVAAAPQAQPGPAA